MNPTIDLLLRNLRTEVNKIVKENEELKASNHQKDGIIKSLKQEQTQVDRKGEQNATS